MALPPCGLYRTTLPLASIPAGRLVYFHNHGNPGAGLYLPSGWALNRAAWNTNGNPLGPADDASTLAPLPVEGLYTVREAFFCCQKRCVRFEPAQLVQLGYDAEATPILFTPEWMASGLRFPERGTRLDLTELGKLGLLRVAQGREMPADGFIH
jgi:hypothetical protein